MSHLVICQRCGEDEELNGKKVGDEIFVECQSCGLVWSRNLLPSCGKCSSLDVHPAFEAIILKSRGSQLSVESSKLIYLCTSCDIARLRQYQKSNSPIMPENLPNS